MATPKTADEQELIPTELFDDSDMRPPRVRQPPDRRPILIATKAMIFMGQDNRESWRMHDA